MRSLPRFALVLLAACGPGTAAPPAQPAPKQLAVKLAVAWENVPHATDIQFAVAGGTTAIVLQQEGTAQWFATDGTARGTAFRITDLKAGGELGLLGVAFHPQFGKNGRFFVSYTAPGGTAARSRIEEWRVAGANLRTGSAAFVKRLLEVDQPYSNHNGGQIQFGPDGLLYIGFGDGGAGGDPEGRAQNRATLLGKLLRIGVDGADAGLPYAIPPGNPFAGKTGVRPEIYALGLRNPWRFSWAPDGRLIAADVGQNAWEELSFVPAGGNLGWDIREGAHCFEPPAGCDAAGLVEPFHEYPHQGGGISVTGGYVYTGARVPLLKGKYVFGDLSGKLWALELPAGAAKAANVVALAPRLDMVTTFGRDPDGELYVADWRRGVVYRLAQ